VKLSVPDLDLIIEATNRTVEGDGGPYLDWIECKVRISVEGFTGGIPWRVMPAELRSFVGGLQGMYDTLTPGTVAVLESVEPGVRLQLTLFTAGHLQGAYDLQNGPLGPRLSGTFTMDQTYLPDLVAGVCQLLETPGTTLTA
jgi:hypothetical protein